MNKVSYLNIYSKFSYVLCELDQYRFSDIDARLATDKETYIDMF